MSRAKKTEEKAKDNATSITHISINDFLETRNTVVTGLSTLQSAISDLSRSYLNHTDNLIGRGTGTLNFAPPFTENALFAARGPTPGPMTDGPPETKKRKRAPHDKNAPKRALTPFFLYLQSARPTIADEMGQGHTAKEVQDEGGRRWREMPQDEKDGWTEQYAINFARYKEKMKAYKEGLPIPEISDADAKRLYEQTKSSGGDVGTAQIVSANTPTDDEGSEASDDTSSGNDSPEPIKAPSPVPASKKQKTAKEASKRKQLAAEPEPVLDPALRSPEKKKPGKKGRGNETVDVKGASTEIPAAQSSKAGEKQKKKKRKSGPNDY